ncbi:Aste57867_15157 [Aphanomyces stellatus]|uniref:Aste57867_15157 protein n=1 Tax=Aphanomyces stellatus TaxID=120398 RepID=A0A485L2I8_9STRA|nr:hypothetical protein As57867_015101 [Aphanomyces stellatus]VFT91966.1 Aste57867_15157 [Aphanomyces stellatus]
MGGAASIAPNSIEAYTKEECQALCGDVISESEWQKYAINGTITRDALTKIFAVLTDAFLTHDSGTDDSTHKKVSTINKLLKARGITTWFDEEKMEGNVKQQMIHGIDYARVIVVFVTQRYIDKVGGSNAEDNCQLEFNYAARRKTASKMIPVLIDPSPSLKNPATWTGEVGFVLGGHLYLDLSNAFDDEQLLATRVDELVAKIVSVGGTSIAQRLCALQTNQVEAEASGAPPTPLTAATMSKSDVPTALNESQDPATMAFEKLKADLTPPDWVQLYDYKLERNGRNSVCDSDLCALQWPPDCCSLSLESGFFANGNFRKELREDHLRLQSLGGRLDKQAFLLSFHVKLSQGNVTPICAGMDPWFAIDVTDQKALVVTLHDQSFPVTNCGAHVVLPVDAWLRVAVCVHLESVKQMQVIVDDALMDKIPLAPTFEHGPKPSNGNEFHLVRRTTRKKLFHGHLRHIALYSSLPASRQQPRIQPMAPAVHQGHAQVLQEWVVGMHPLVHYPHMHVDVVDTVSGSAMVLPAGSFVHPVFGVYFDGDFALDRRLNPQVAVVGRFQAQAHLHPRNFVAATTIAPLGPGWVLSVRGLLGVCITYDLGLQVVPASQATGDWVCLYGTPVTLKRHQAVDIAVRMRGGNVDVLVGDKSMDPIELGHDDNQTTEIVGEGVFELLDDDHGEGCYGFVQRLELWFS